MALQKDREYFSHIRNIRSFWGDQPSHLHERADLDSFHRRGRTYPHIIRRSHRLLRLLQAKQLLRTFLAGYQTEIDRGESRVLVPSQSSLSTSACGNCRASSSLQGSASCSQVKPASGER